MATVTLSWSANPGTDNVTQYQVWGAPGTSVAFASCTLLQSTDSLNATIGNLAANTAYTFYVVAVNAVGASSPEGPVDITTATTQYNVAGATFSCADISQKPLNRIVARYPAGYAWTLPAVADGGLAEGKVDVAPSADTVFALLKDGASIATVKFASGSTTATLIDSTDTAFAIGDYLDLQTPSNLNGMAGAFGLTVIGNR